MPEFEPDRIRHGPAVETKRYFVNYFLRMAGKRRELMKRFLDKVNEEKYDGFSEQESEEINKVLDEISYFCEHEFPKPRR